MAENAAAYKAASKELRRTESLCDVCMNVVPALVEARGVEVWLVKECPEHGRQEALIWSDVESYEVWERQSQHAAQTLDGTGEACNCPYSCGLCDGHEGDTCTAILHLTNRCNLRCPTCFAAAGPSGGNEGKSAGARAPELTFAQVEGMLDAVAAKTCVPTVQLSGGEPTLRDDLPDIIRAAKDRGVRHVQVNTNGLRLAEEPAYAAQLAQAGCDLVYLQFDGVDEGAYRALRGRPLLEEKKRAIENCREAGLGVLLVVTVCEGVNDGQLGDIVRFAAAGLPIVRGIHFQPVTSSGRTSGRRAITFPDLFRLLEEQTNGQVSAAAVEPRKKFDAHCSFSAVFFAGPDGTLMPLTSGPVAPGGRDDKESGSDAVAKPVALKPDVDVFAEDAVDYAARYWRATRRSCCCCGTKSQDNAESADGEKQVEQPGAQPAAQPVVQPDDELAARLHDHTLSLSGMHFQDVHTIDLARTRGCCVHVIVPDGRSIPFCTYYLTSENGERLYDWDGTCLHGRTASAR